MVAFMDDERIDASSGDWREYRRMVLTKIDDYGRRLHRLEGRSDEAFSVATSSSIRQEALREDIARLGATIERVELTTTELRREDMARLGATIERVELTTAELKRLLNGGGKGQGQDKSSERSDGGALIQIENVKGKWTVTGIIIVNLFALITAIMAFIQSSP
jgi:hypothetical protein